jgi:hypothetical protein
LSAAAVCVAYQGDSPVEYPSEEDPEEREPFSLTDVKASSPGSPGEQALLIPARPCGM